MDALQVSIWEYNKKDYRKYSESVSEVFETFSNGYISFVYDTRHSKISLEVFSGV